MSTWTQGTVLPGAFSQPGDCPAPLEGATCPRWGRPSPLPAPGPQVLALVSRPCTVAEDTPAPFLGSLPDTHGWPGNVDT